MTNPLDNLLAENISSESVAASGIVLRQELAKRISSTAQQLITETCNVLNQTIDAFWGYANPQALADELDKQNGAGFTATLFENHAAMSEMLLARFPKALAGKIKPRPKGYKVEIDSNQTSHHYRRITCTREQ